MNKTFKISDDYLNAFKFGIKFLILVSALSIPLVVGTTVVYLTDLIFKKIPVLYVSEFKILQLQTYPFSKQVLAQQRGSFEQIEEIEKPMAINAVNLPKGFVLDQPEENLGPSLPNGFVLDKPLPKMDIFDQILSDKPTKEKLYVLLNRKVRYGSEKNELGRDIANILTDSETRTITYLDNPVEKVYSIPDWRKTIDYGHFTLIGGWIFGIIVFFTVIICFALYFPIFKAFSNLLKDGKIIK